MTFRRLKQKLAALCGFFICPMCNKTFRNPPKYFIGGQNVCSRCAGDVISKNIAGWYGDHKK